MTDRRDSSKPEPHFKEYTPKGEPDSKPEPYFKTPKPGDTYSKNEQKED